MARLQSAITPRSFTAAHNVTEMPSRVTMAMFTLPGCSALMTHI